MQWIIVPTGSPEYLRELARAVDGPELSIREEGDQFIIRSDQLKPDLTADRAQKIGADIVKLLDGAAMIALDRRDPIGMGSVRLVRDDGTMTIYPPAIVSGFRLGGTAVAMRLADGREREFHPADQVLYWLRSAEKDEAVARILRYMTKDLDWGTLYNVHEAIERDMGGEDKIEKAGWATKKEQGRFTHTANNYTAVGEDARHSRTDWKPPADPMSLGEARSFITALARTWLNHKSMPSAAT